MKVLFLSDLHLGAKYINNPREHEAAVCQFLANEGADADHIYLLGDILDYWYEYRYVVPRGHVRFFGTLARLADSGISITWLTGNHDIWIFDYLSQELGIEVLDTPYFTQTINGKKFILTHGDRIGRGSFGFNLISKLFRSKLCQTLFAAIHPRWTVPFAHRWSSNSRFSREIADGSTSDQERFIIDEAQALIANIPDADYLVMGHHHIMMNEKIGPANTQLIVLGDWINHFSYAIFDGQCVKLCQFETAREMFAKT